ncbi:MAG: glycosyltransferase [Anaerolineaceae bacterium]|jgi:hypothetical protein
MINNLSIITTHFFDFDWTLRLIDSIQVFTPFERIDEILIINQDRALESHRKLQELSPFVRVVEYPRSEKHFKVQGHDHANVLNRAIREVIGDYLCIFDSDAHPINTSWLQACEEILTSFDAVLALVPGKVNETHPCFMMMKKDCVGRSVSFDESLFTTGVDTGRLVGRQLTESGHRVYFAPPTKAFNGLWGNIYLNSIYHHGKASFNGAEDDRIRQQINWRNRYFKKFVIEKHRYELTFSENLLYKIQKEIRKEFGIH